MKTLDLRPRRTLAYAAAKGFDPATRTLRAVISTANKDRHGEIVLPTAFERHIEHFLANPVVLAGHQHRLEDGSVPVIGMVKAIEFFADRVEAVIQFAPADVNPLGPKYERAYELGFMRAFSVGFIPIEIRVEQGEPVTHVESELIELTCCAVPSNRQSVSGAGKDVAALVAGLEMAGTDADPESGAVEMHGAGDDLAGVIPVEASAKVRLAAIKARAEILDACSPTVKSWLRPATRTAPAAWVTATLDNGQRVRISATKDGALQVDAEAAAPEVATVKLDAESLTALQAAEQAIGAHAKAIQESTARLEAAVAALLGVAEEPAASGDTKTPDAGNVTVEALLQVLQKQSGKRA